MIEKINKYKIFGRKKGRKKILNINSKFFKKIKINILEDEKNYNKIILDIGSGNGENSIFLAKKNPDSLVIACEIFDDGNINLSNSLYNLKLLNVKLFNNNVQRFLDNIEKRYHFDEIWILFPDPWPKKKHHKRRLVNNFFLNKIYPYLKKNCKVFIATDSISYLNSIFKTMYDLRDIYQWINYHPMEWVYKSIDLPHTKFFEKAQKLQKSSFFIELEKI